MMRSQLLLASSLTCGLLGCADLRNDPGPVFGFATGGSAGSGGAPATLPGTITLVPPRPANAEAVPLHTRQLVLSADGTLAHALDPVGRRLFTVPLDDPSGLVETHFEGTPARVFVEGGLLYVTFRDRNSLALLAADGSTVIASRDVCRTPEGLGRDGDDLIVACRDGRLLSVDPESLGERRSVFLDTDLRDVVVRVGKPLVVTRFGTAELLIVDAEGGLIERLRPPPESGRESRVGWRTIALPDGTLAVLHQSNRLSLEAGIQGYSSVPPSSLVVSILNPEATGAAPASNDPSISLDPRLVQQQALGGSGFGDLALHGGHLAAFTASGAFALRTTEMLPGFVEPTVRWIGSADAPFPPEIAPEPRSIGIASHPAHERLWLLVDDGRRLVESGGGRAFQLHTEPRESFAFDLFHGGTPTGLTCATCHPEGREDGYAWSFNGEPIRTQTLEGGLTSLPLHRNGEHETLAGFLKLVFTGKMRGPALEAEHVSVVETFLARIPGPQAATVETAAITEGRALFLTSEVGCAGCHVGDRGTDGWTHDVGTGGPLVTPPLRGLALRPPFLHDGAAATLRDVFGLAGGGDAHGHVSSLTDSELDALVAYLESL